MQSAPGTSAFNDCIELPARITTRRKSSARCINHGAGMSCHPSNLSSSFSFSFFWLFFWFAVAGIMKFSPLSLSYGYALLFSGLKSNCFLLHQSQMSQLEVFSSGHPQHLAYDMHFSLSLYLDNYFFPQHIQMSGWQASYAPGVSAPPVQGQGFHASVFSAPRTVSDTLKELPRCVLNGFFKINNQGCFHEQMEVH